MPYVIGLCDDEAYQIKVNGLFLKEIAAKNNYDLEYHGFTTGKQLLNYIEKKHIDILFLDIDLGEESGIEIATILANKYPNLVTVFVTGHREFAQEAFEVEALGYLVKPFDIKKMESILRKAILQVSGLQNEEQSVNEIVITNENLKKKISCNDILYIQRQQARSIIVTADKEYSIYETITSLSERLGPDFVRVNQGEIVNINQISDIKDNYVLVKNGPEMSIGRTYRKTLLAKYFGEEI